MFSACRESSSAMQLLLLSFLCIAVVRAGRQFTCPNSGEPKIGVDGAVVQCLPGQASEVVCGRGYSCFFSGFNYQCCPTAEEDYDQQFADAECPLGSLSVLDSTGNALRCNPRTGSCPKANMFCARQGPTPICCESLRPSNSHQARPSTTTTRKPTTTRPRPRTTTPAAEELDVLELECPENSLTVLGDNGQLLECNRAHKCPSDGMYCHRVGGKSVCCERLDTAKNVLDDEQDFKIKNLEEETEDAKEEKFSPLKYTPDDIARIRDELRIEQELERAVVKQAQSTTPKTPKNDKKPSKLRGYIDNENTKYISLAPKPEPRSSERPTSTTTEEPLPEETPVITTADNFFTTEEDVTTTSEPRRSHDGHARAFAVNTNAEVNHSKKVKELMEYQPHSSGGYAISRKLEKINGRASRPNHKALAQQFLVDQIRQGWPYDDKFYRPENIAVIKRGGRTEAIVHFPN